MAYPVDRIYKLYNNPLPGGGLDGVMTQKDNKTICIPLDPENTDYQQFVEDIHTHGLGIVEGADAETQISYVNARKTEYPPLEEQLDKIYHSGVDAWKADIKVIKDKYPKTQVAITTVADLPDWVVGIST